MPTEKAVEFGKIFLKSIEDEKGSATYEFVEMAIKALKQEPILDKIRAEIEASKWTNKDVRIERNALASGLDKALEIIDKYKTESEDKVGHWYKANSGDICYTCSKCGVTNASGTKYNYCPHCGAKMTESEEKE